MINGLRTPLQSPFRNLRQDHPNQVQPAALVDRGLFFGNPEVTWAQLSPDGEYLAFLKPWENTLNLWVKKADDPFADAVQLSAEKQRPIASYHWSRDGKYLLYVKDRAGDENFNLYAVDAHPHASVFASCAARQLTDIDHARVVLYELPRSQPDIVYIGINHRDKAWHDLYRLRLSTGELLLVRENTERIRDWYFDLEANLRLVLRVADNGDQEILRVDTFGLTKIYSCTVFESCAVLRFHNDGKRVYLVTNKGESDLTTLALLDSETGATQLLESDPVGRVDFQTAEFSEQTCELLLTSYREHDTRYYFRDRAAERDFESLCRQFPDKEIALTSRSADEEVWLLTLSSDREPGAIYSFNRTQRRLALQYSLRPNLPREALASMSIINYESSDGLKIPAYLMLPTASAIKPFPTVILPHGGPWSRYIWGYNGTAQFLANRGYAVLMPNFRGSTGYGKSFLDAGNGEWGGKMQDDITWGVQHLISEGIVDARRVAIMGASYGGYASLAGIAFTPDLFAAAIDLFGPSNLVTLLESAPPYWAAERRELFTRMADPETSEGRDWLQERSPLNRVHKIKAPLLVVQGANDPRVNRAEADQIVTALRKRGRCVEYLLLPDEGHGFTRAVNNLAVFAAIENFLAKHLGGRCQAESPPDVIQRLKEITIED